ncbi:MAG: iron-containing alcohol dehydrogenase, partial [Chloroflexi bacterium]|nr:iron-containing alcohol dehydrogenase [Chloroflexota bacterium]
MSSVIWSLPKVTFTSIADIEEKRPVALITNPETWAQLGDSLKLPLVVQAEPESTDQSYLKSLAANLPGQVKVVYAVGTGDCVTSAKVVARENGLPLIIVPDALDSDEIFESHVVLPSEGLLNRITTGSPEQIFIDWDVIQNAPLEKRAAAIVDVLAIITALLDWRHAGRENRNTSEQKFLPWVAFAAGQLATQAVKSSEAIGNGDPEALRTLLNLVMMSVQLAQQLGHDRHEEGTEHYFAFSMENQGVKASHAELVGAGILFATALHGNDPSSLRDALMNAGINIDGLRASDIRLAINDLPNFVVVNDLPYALAHDLDPMSTRVSDALDKAGILHQTVEEAGKAEESEAYAEENMMTLDVPVSVSSEPLTFEEEDVIDGEVVEVYPEDTAESEDLDTAELAMKEEAASDEEMTMLPRTNEDFTTGQMRPPANNAFATPSIDEETNEMLK